MFLATKNDLLVTKLIPNNSNKIVRNSNKIVQLVTKLLTKR